MDSKRKEDRTQTKGGIIYVLSSPDSSDAVQSGLISNISDSGACIYTQECINESTDIRIYLGNVSQTPINAKVKWCSQASDDLFRAGLQIYA
ncbi:MAG: PilZ domain-containing protein [Thermodesulfovibrionales bacterium]|nr:PilZ domain-containing protein [Thermodesulfovibrionales bacterium]